LITIYHPDDYDPSREDEAMSRDIDALNDEMKAARVMIFVGGLSPARSARSLRAQPAGKVLVTDGPYIKTEEHIGDFWVLEAADLDEALESLRDLGIKTAIVSNTSWGSPASEWRQELARHGLLDRVDATVFCVDVGWRKPHPAPFERALTLLDVIAGEALFVGDDHRCDVLGAKNAGMRPVLLEPHPTNSLPDDLVIWNLGDAVALATDAFT
jgi:HAD superfamily hydrolase (TIGR01662 family)